MKFTQTLLIIAVILLPPASASALSRVIHVEWEYPYYTGNISGFRLYHDSSLACEVNVPDATSIDCPIDVADGPASFTLAAVLPDGTEGTSSLPLTYIFSSTLKAVATADILLGDSPLPVTFDASNSTGNIVLYEWIFGDGETGTGVTANHIFAIAGSYTVTLKTTDTIGATDLATLFVTVTDPVIHNSPPTAVISSSSTVGTAPLPVQFDGSESWDSDGTIQSHEWELGDGGIHSGPQVDHTYSFPGLFNSRLTVTDNGGLKDSISTPVIVSTPAGNGNISPNAVITASKNAGVYPLTVSFSADKSNDPDGEIVSYSWNFGDGTSSSEPRVTHTFTQPAIYTVTLKVTDNKGASSQIARTNINVLASVKEEEKLLDQVRKVLPYIMNLLLKSQ